MPHTSETKVMSYLVQSYRVGVKDLLKGRPSTEGRQKGLDFDIPFTHRSAELMSCTFFERPHRAASEFEIALQRVDVDPKCPSALQVKLLVDLERSSISPAYFAAKLVKKTQVAAQGDLSMDWLRPFMARRKYRKGDVLFRRGEQACEMLITRSGIPGDRDRHRAAARPGRGASSAFWRPATSAPRRSNAPRMGKY
jgi:hypothetical protein